MPANVKMMVIKEPTKKPRSNKRKTGEVDRAPDGRRLRAMTELKTIPEFNPMFLAAKNPHPLDLSIKFVEESHTYFVKFHTGNFSCEHVLSTSGFVHNYFGHFDADKIVKKMGQRTRNMKYKGMSNSQIKAAWKKSGEEASAIGTNFHFLLESYYNGFDLTPYDDYNVVQQFRRWHQKHVVPHKLVPFRSEQRMRTDLKTRLTGTADMLFALPDQDPTSGVLKLVMRDWKFSKQIKFSSPFGESFGCCSQLDDCNYSHYLLQQNTYKYMLEQFYKNWKYQGHTYLHVEIVGMALAVFHDSQEDFQHIVLPEIQPLIEEMFLDREQQLKHLMSGDEKKAEAVIKGIITTPNLTAPSSSLSSSSSSSSSSSTPMSTEPQQGEPQILLISADDEDDEDDDEPLEPLS